MLSVNRSALPELDSNASRRHRGLALGLRSFVIFAALALSATATAET